MSFEVKTGLGATGTRQSSLINKSESRQKLSTEISLFIIKIRVVDTFILKKNLL